MDVPFISGHTCCYRRIYLLLDLLVILDTRIFICKKFNHSTYLIIRYKCTLKSCRFLISLRIKEHITFSKKLLGSVHIQNCPGIHTGRYGESNSGRHIRLDQTGDNIYRRSLCGNDQMDTCRTCKLGQTTDSILHLSGSNHHKVGKLIHDDHDLRHFHRFFFSSCRLDLLCFFIIFIQITDTVLRKCIVTVCHLLYCPV